MSQRKDTGLNTNPWPKLLDHYIHILNSYKSIVGEAFVGADIMEDENLPSYKINVGLLRLKKIVFKISPDDKYKQFREDKMFWFIKWQAILTYPSHITFLLPLIMVSIAFCLTILE